MSKIRIDIFFGFIGVYYGQRFSCCNYPWDEVILGLQNVGTRKKDIYYNEAFSASRYDLDNSGAIDKDEMVNVMKSIYSMVDGNVSEANRGSTMDKVKTR